MSREFVNGCVATAPNENEWVRRSEHVWEIDSRCPMSEAARRQGRKFLLTDEEVCILGLTVTWPEPEPSVWELKATHSKALLLPECWEPGDDALVIRKAKVLSDKLVTAGDGYNVPGPSTTRVIVVLEAE